MKPSTKLNPAIMGPRSRVSSTKTAATRTSTSELYETAIWHGASIHAAMELYGVSRESLRVRVKGLIPADTHRGLQILYISRGADIGLLEAIRPRAVHRKLWRRACARYRTISPNEKWIQCWIRKHSAAVSFRKAQILDAKRAEASTVTAVRHYFVNLEAVIKRLNLEDKPDQICNCGETGGCPQGRCNERVVRPKHMLTNAQRSPDRENASIMGYINAAGGTLSSMYIFGGVRRKAEWMEGAAPSAVCAMSETSNINGFLFLHWFKWFVSELPATRPQLLILDGHFAHLSMDTVKYANEQDMHLFVLPAHAPHFLQSLDVAVYQPFKTLYEKSLKRFPLENQGRLPTKNTREDHTRPS